MKCNPKGGGFVLALALCLAASASAVTVDFYTSKGPNGAATGLNLAHALVADGADEDRNGPTDVFAEGATYAGDGIPDGLQVSVLEYLYATPGAPYRALAMDAFEQNRQALIDWNGGVCSYPDGNGPGSTQDQPVYGPLFAFADFPYCDLFSSGVDVPVCFAKCTANSALILEVAAYVTVSEYARQANSKWHVLNYGLPVGPLLVDVDSDPSFNRAGAAVFGINGDLDGDGLSNLTEYRSVARAAIAATPSLAGVTPAGLWARLTRAGKDSLIGRYIDVAVYLAGPDPGDPDPPLFGITYQSSDTWAEEGATITFFVETENALHPLSYEWFRDGAPVSDGPAVQGATSARLRLSPLSLTDSAQYTCRVEDALGRIANARPIQLTVFEADALPGPGPVSLFGAATLLLCLGRRRCRRSGGQ